jgi:hypothetical protein
LLPREFMYGCCLVLTCGFLGAGSGEGFGLLGCSSRGWPQIGHLLSRTAHQGDQLFLLPFLNIFCILFILYAF